ncbi:hypothetical protein DVH24_028010 [Malus domestica]|uniref:RNA-binding protein AU-1/Ribonuclease E/G domain-containing protein n=1 Tax=Malus domestica TaxID=3750 RepID=A0A498HFN2_MALDO|nr:hypothetical protein DVH24_028010 [Malus domestica]
MSPIRSWGSWVEEAYLPIQLLFSAPARESESPKKLAYTIKSHAKTLQPPGFGLTVRTVAAGHSLEELQKDLEGLVSTWKNITEHAKSAALAADEGVEGAIPVILQRGNGSLSVVQDYFIETVSNYLQEIAPDLCDRVEVPLANGGSLVIEQTEALVSIDVNGGLGMFGHGNSQEKAILEVNLAAAKEAMMEERPDPGNPKSWPKFILRVDRHMCEYLTSGKRTRLAFLRGSLKVWILLKVARGFTRGAFEVKPFSDEESHKDPPPETISMLRSSEGRANNSVRKVTLFPVIKWKTGRK